MWVSGLDGLNQFVGGWIYDILYILSEFKPLNMDDSLQKIWYYLVLIWSPFWCFYVLEVLIKLFDG